MFIFSCLGQGEVELGIAYTFFFKSLTKNIAFYEKRIRHLILHLFSFLKQNRSKFKLRSNLVVTALSWTNLARPLTRFFHDFDSDQIFFVFWIRTGLQRKYFCVNPIVTLGVVVKVSKVIAMLAFGHPVNPTNDVGNRCVNSRHIGFTTSYSPGHNSSQNMPKNTKIQSISKLPNPRFLHTECRNILIEWELMVSFVNDRK